MTPEQKALVERLQMEVYLGDGLYVSYNGRQILFKAPRAEGDHWVALEPQGLKEFDRYVRNLREMERELAKQLQTTVGGDNRVGGATPEPPVSTDRKPEG